MCTNRTTLDQDELDCDFLVSATEKLKQLEGDELLIVKGSEVLVTDKGQLFIRNICASLDARMWRKSNSKRIFSKAI